MADAIRIEPIKSSDIGQKQLRALSNVPFAVRIDTIAEGLPILLRSAETLYAAREAVGASGRVGQILQGQATEEAAKILILLDYVRCPSNLTARAHGQLSAVYDHGARLIYAQACRWKPVDVEMLRGYVDLTRVSHYVEGDFGEFILPNWELYTREARLYADLVRSDDGALVWNDPDDWPEALDLFGLPPAVISVTRALSRLGAFTRRGLAVIHEVWAGTAFQSAEDHSRSDRLIQETVSRLLDEGLATVEATGEDVQTLYSDWQMPMYAIDVRARAADLETLRAEQAAQLNGLY